MNKREFQMWAQLAYCKELTNNDLKGLMIILTYHNAIVRGGKWNNTPNKVIAKSLGLSDRRTIDVINRLVNMGLVTRQKKVHGNANHLHPNLEAIESMINRNMEELGIVTETSPTIVTSASPIKEGYMTETSPTIVTSASPTIVTSTSPNTNKTMKIKKANKRDPYNPLIEDEVPETPTMDIDAMYEQSLGTIVEYDDDGLSKFETTHNPKIQQQYSLSPSKEDCAPSSKACHSAKDLRRQIETMKYDNPTNEDYDILMVASKRDTLISEVLNCVIHLIESKQHDSRLNDILDNEIKTINGLSNMNYSKRSYISKYNEAMTLLNEG